MIEEHCFVMDITVGSSKRERGTDSDPPTPCKLQKGKKKKKKVDRKSGQFCVQFGCIGCDINTWNKGRLSMQMKQHSAMIASVAKSVQINAQEFQECKDKLKMIEQQIESLTEVNNDLNVCVLVYERINGCVFA